MADKDDKNDDSVTMSKGELAALMARLDKVEKGDDGGNPIVARTCNSCGRPVNEKTGKCDTHPTEHVNHIAMGLDVETGLKRPVIKSQTRA